MISVTDLEGSLKEYIADTKRLLEELLQKTQRVGRVDVYLVGNSFMKKQGAHLLEHYAKRKGKVPENGLFNVLAFPAQKDFPHPEAKESYLGEIYVNPKYIKSQNESVVGMLVHGFVHLIGYNHEHDDDRIEMETLEDQLISSLEIPDSLE